MNPIHHEKIVFLLGMPRSNTTIIHRTLAKHAEVYAPSLSELLFPFENFKDKSGRLLLSLIPQKIIDKVYNPLIHKTGTTEPEALDAAIFKKHRRGVLAWVHSDALNGVASPTFEIEDLKYIKSLVNYWNFKNPGKIICLKYFDGIRQFKLLKQTFPNAKFIVSTREPESLVKSSATLIEMVMNARRKTPTEAYWKSIYKNIVENYKAIQNISEMNNDKVLTINNENLKTNFSAELNKMCSFLEIPFQEEMTPTPYKKKYEYSKKMNPFFEYSDFV